MNFTNTIQGIKLQPLWIVGFNIHHCYFPQVKPKNSTKMKSFCLDLFLLISVASAVLSNLFQSKRHRSSSICFKAHDIVLFQSVSKHTTSFTVLFQSVSSTRVRAHALSYDFLSTTTLQLQNLKYITLKLQSPQLVPQS